MAAFGGRLVKDKLWFYGSQNWAVHHFTLLNIMKEDGTQADPWTVTNAKVSYQMSRANKLIFFLQHDDDRDQHAIAEPVPTRGASVRISRDNDTVKGGRQAGHEAIR